MKIPFLDRFTGSVICEIEIADGTEEKLRVKVALQLAVGKRADLSWAGLSRADLSRACLSGANLRGADLSRANLSWAGLGRAGLSRAGLSRADLSDANLRGADLRGADLSRADLSRANLSEANLSEASLSRANLSGANLRWANLSGAYLSGANLSKAELPNFFLCPEEGAFIAWKKLLDGCVAKLEIPAKAGRACSLVGRKMRAEYVKTLAIWDADGKAIKSGLCRYSAKTLYRVGEITRSDKYDDDPRVECTQGIHFFITRKEAETY